MGVVSRSIGNQRKVADHSKAQSIYNVVQTPYGRLGSLNCWEHIQVRLLTALCVILTYRTNTALVEDRFLFPASPDLRGWMVARI